MKNQWRVTAYTGKNRDKILRTTFVRADTEAEAMDLGRRALRLLGTRGSFRVSASPYSPVYDLNFLGYLAVAK